VRAAVNPHYLAVLRPLLHTAQSSGQLEPDTDVEMFLALIMLVLPHLAIAPGQPGLDAVLGLSEDQSPDQDCTRQVVDRLISALRTGFGPHGR
jgi:hypothetical protein